MKMVDFSSWFDADEARLAIFSSFEFEPIHFESRLMRSKALSGARRIIVFVDADQFQKLLTERPPARWINQRYLVVPVKRKSGEYSIRSLACFWATTTPGFSAAATISPSPAVPTIWSCSTAWWSPRAGMNQNWNTSTWSRRRLLFSNRAWNLANLRQQRWPSGGWTRRATNFPG